MKIVYMGTPDFAVPALKKIVEAGHEVVGVYTKEPKPAGQGLRISYSPVYRTAEQLGIRIFTPKTFKNPDAIEEFKNLNADLGVVCAYGLILPQAVLDAPKKGCWNIHASLLPRWRGAAPIQRAIQAGDKETGVTIMQMDAGVDTGDILSQEKVMITPTMTGGELHDILSEKGSDLLLKTIKNPPTPQKQPSEATYANKLIADDLYLDWKMKADLVDASIRAFCPYPGKRVYIGSTDSKNQIKIYRTDVVNINHTAEPGTVLDDKLLIACSQGAVRIRELQRAGKDKQLAEDFLNGTKIPVGTQLIGANNLSFFLGLDNSTSVDWWRDLKTKPENKTQPMYKECATKLR